MMLTGDADSEAVEKKNLSPEAVEVSPNNL